jgi:hypothetical protein
MATVTFDKLSYAQMLRSGGFSETQAETSAHALDSALRDSVATKSDLEREGAALRSEVAKANAELKHEIAMLRSEAAETKAELKHDIAMAVSDMKREMTAQKYELLRWLVPVIFGQAALVVALMKLL